MFKDNLPELYREVEEGLSQANEVNLLKQLPTLKINTCESFASDNSAFTIEFETQHKETIEDTFPVVFESYTVMFVYSKNDVALGVDIIGCENTSLQQQLLACCT